MTAAGQIVASLLVGVVLFLPLAGLLYGVGWVARRLGIGPLDFDGDAFDVLMNGAAVTTMVFVSLALAAMFGGGLLHALGAF